MADILSPERRSENMRRIRAKNTHPEMIVRRLVFSMGYRYRLHWPKLPGKPDIVLPGRRKVIFVHGCFWHQHDDPNCPIVRQPKCNQAYWANKLATNRRRDLEIQARLREQGWAVLVVWECQLRDLDQLRSIVRSFVHEMPEK